MTPDYVVAWTQGLQNVMPHCATWAPRRGARNARRGRSRWGCWSLAGPRLRQSSPGPGNTGWQGAARTDCGMTDSAPPVLAYAAGEAGTIYEQSLLGMVGVLTAASETHWLAWIEEDLRLWKDQGTTEHHQKAYGGMGSFNDSRLSNTEPAGWIRAAWLDAALDQLQHIAAASAGAAGGSPDRFVQVAAGSICGRHLDLHWYRCRSCGAEFIGEWERAVSSATGWSSGIVPVMIGAGHGSAVAAAAVGEQKPDGRQPYVDHVERRVDDLGLQRREIGKHWESPCPVCGEIAWWYTSVAAF
jgi:hypothetical protein